MKKNKKVLVLSNGCFSDSDSNGRTLEQLCSTLGCDQLAQFFVYGTPNEDFCSRYYQVSDGTALRSFLKQRELGGEPEKTSASVISAPAEGGKVKKTPLSMLLREIAWKFGKWNGAKLEAWIDEFAPDVLLVSLGDNAFLPRLAIQIAKKRSIPIYVYSTENYNFKKYNYITQRPSLFYWLFYLWMNRMYDALVPYVSCGIFNTPLLAEAYEERYHYPCCCIFNTSDIQWVSNWEIREPLKVSYLGNLDVNRHVPMIELANLLAELFPGTQLDFYGKLPDDPSVREMITNCPNICCRGFVSYQEVVRIIHESTLLVHAECGDPFWTKDLKFGFSTKIADSVCSGTPLLIYARKDLAVTDFLIRNQCAFIAEDKEQLKEVLYQALTDEKARSKVLEVAAKVKQEHFTQQGKLQALLEKG